jgi:hypothetical protein
MPFGQEYSCNKGPVISGTPQPWGMIIIQTQDQVFNFLNSLISPLQNMKSRKTNKTSMFIFCIYMLIPYSKAQNQTELGFKRRRKKERKNVELKMDY